MASGQIRRLIEPVRAGRGAGRFRVHSPPEEACQWGTLGVPTAGAGEARLLHVIRTDTAILRHAFYGAGARVDRHAHQHAEFVYGVGGPCLECATDGSASKRRLTYHPAGHEHALAYSGPTHVLAIELFDGAGLPGATVALPATFYGIVWEVMGRVIRSEPTARIDEAIAQLVAAARSIAEQRTPRWFGALLDRIHDQWQVPPSATRFAADLAVSPAYLCRTFRRCAGVTLQQYGLLLRIDRARGLLWGSDMAISRIAAETGFADQSHLTRALACHSRQTPLRLRWSAPCLHVDRTRLDP